MRILLVNDDGITAEGLAVAQAIATEIAGGGENVWVVAPAFEQSGVGHCVSFVRPLLTQALAPQRVAVEGSPADCVLVALHDVMKEAPPDLVLSGVNRGRNVAEDTLYSGTVGGAMEAALQGYRAIALSQVLGPRNRTAPDPFEAARRYGVEVVRRILAADIWEDHRYGVFYNVNFPPFPAAEVTGVMGTRQGHRPKPTFVAEAQQAPNMRSYLWLKHPYENEPVEPGTDGYEAQRGAITVTPLRADLTARDLVEGLHGQIAQPL
ncbi:MAG: 5'/3'-nucleotidase SurE [Pseudomonadota bacterium]